MNANANAKALFVSSLRLNGLTCHAAAMAAYDVQNRKVVRQYQSKNPQTGETTTRIREYGYGAFYKAESRFLPLEDETIKAGSMWGDLLKAASSSSDGLVFDLIQGTELMLAYKEKQGDSSCMTGEKNYKKTALWGENPNTKMVVVSDETGCILRALVHKAKTDEGDLTLVDRTYPPLEAYTFQGPKGRAIAAYFSEQGWLYRSNNSSCGNPSCEGADLRVYFPEAIMPQPVRAWMDVQPPSNGLWPYSDSFSYVRPRADGLYRLYTYDPVAAQEEDSYETAPIYLLLATSGCHPSRWCSNCSVERWQGDCFADEDANNTCTACRERFNGEDEEDDQIWSEHDQRYYDSDEDLVCLHDGDYCLSENAHQIGGDWYHDSEVCFDVDNEPFLEDDDGYVQIDGDWYHHEDHRVVVCEDGEQRLRSNCTYSEYLWEWVSDDIGVWALSDDLGQIFVLRENAVLARTFSGGDTVFVAEEYIQDVAVRDEDGEWVVVDM